MPTLTKSQKIILGVLVVVLLSLGVIVYERLSPHGIFAGLQNDLKTIVPDESSPYTDLDGNPIDLSEFKGKPLIINSWATWMPFSKDELVLLRKSTEKYKDTITVLAINRMEQTPVIRSYLDLFGLVSQDSIQYLTDPSDNFYKAIGGYAMPETVFYAEDGTMVQHSRGVLNEADLIQYIEAIIEK